ncbi:MAG: DNA polymerase III subunit delta [Ruthenibacterium lactatiformans]
MRSYAAKTLALLAKQEDDAEVTRVEGPAPSIEEAVAAAGTISFFGTKRIVELPMLEPSAMNEADVGALCDLMQSLENAVLVMSTVFKDDKAKLSKKAKQLIGAAEKAGLTAELVKPGPQDAKRFAVEKARELGAVLSPGAASELVERCGTDLFALESELSKLAAVADYGEITPELIAQMGTQSIEADVFEMVRLVTARNKTRAMAKLSQLLELQNEPIAIAAALSGSFVDMYRVKCGARHIVIMRPCTRIFIPGSDYRLRKSGETAPIIPAPAEHILSVLLGLDAALKSSAADGQVLQTALCEVMQIGERR